MVLHIYMDILVDIVSPIFHMKKPRHRLNFKDTQLILDLDLESKCPSSRVKRIPREGRSICKSWAGGDINGRLSEKIEV